MAGCDVELFKEYEDLGNAFQFTSRSRNCNATEIISVTVFHSKKEWTTSKIGINLNTIFVVCAHIMKLSSVTVDYDPCILSDRD